MGAQDIEACRRSSCCGLASMVSFRRDVLTSTMALTTSIAFLGAISFVPVHMTGALRGAPHSGTTAQGEKLAPSHEGQMAPALLAFATAAGVAAGMLNRRRTSKTVRHYVTEKILPNMQWINTGFSSSELENGEIRTVTLAGLDIAVGKTESGKLFAVGDKAPPTGISLSQGGYVEGDLVVEPQYGSKFDAFTGDVAEWCTFPPLIGAAIGAFMGGPTMIATFNVRDGIAVEVDTNARKAYEADYWKGLLDAQGKNDGTYY